MIRKTFFTIITLGLLISSCSDDDDNAPVNPTPTGTSIVINEVSYGTTKWVEILNNGSETVDVSGYWLCLGQGTYVQLGDSPAMGSSDLAANAFAVYNYPNLDNTGGLGLYSTDNFTDADALVDFVQWGAAGSQREDVAVAANQWTAGEFLPTNVSNANTIVYDGTGNSVSDWAETTVPTVGAANEVEAPPMLSLDITGLEALGDDFVYEGWLLVNSANPVSTGRFSEITFPQEFRVNTELLTSANRFVLTIEPADETGDALAAPAASKLLVADFDGNTANITTNTLIGSASTAQNFTDASAVFFLRTPTDEAPGSANNGNDESGIWFGTPGMPPTEGFTNLPELAEGWTYEGWVVVDGVGPVSTGTFTSTTMVDSGNPFSGTENNAGPPIPGEDFLLNAPDGFTFPLDLRGETTVITIEPVPDNAPGPFLLKPLIGSIPADAAFAPTTHPIEYNTSSGFPTGTISR